MDLFLVMRARAVDSRDLSRRRVRPNWLRDRPGVGTACRPLRLVAVQVAMAGRARATERSLAGLPPAFVRTAGYDPLRGEGRQCTDRAVDGRNARAVRLLRAPDPRLCHDGACDRRGEYGGRAVCGRPAAASCDLSASRLDWLQHELKGDRRPPATRQLLERSVRASHGGLSCVRTASTGRLVG